MRHAIAHCYHSFALSGRETGWPPNPMLSAVTLEHVFVEMFCRPQLGERAMELIVVAQVQHIRQCDRYSLYFIWADFIITLLYKRKLRFRGKEISPGFTIVRWWRQVWSAELAASKFVSTLQKHVLLSGMRPSLWMEREFPNDECV